jgi:two-component system, NarL family, response regulator LiaR
MDSSSGKSHVRILIADDHPIVREGLRGLIGMKEGMEVVGEAEDGNEAVRKCRVLKPDLVLMDLIMPHKGGLEAIKEIKLENKEVKILVLSSFIEDDKLKMAIDAGAQGYLLKDSSPHELFRAIHDVLHGELALHPAAARIVIQGLKKTSEAAVNPSPLTEREMEVLKLVAQGATNTQIADTMMISDQTVRSYVTTILSKLNLLNRTQAVLYALRMGIVKLDQPDKLPSDAEND